MTQIAVLGAGAFGTALAIALTQHTNTAVTLWARSSQHVDEMQSHRINAARLPGTPLPDSLRITSQLTDLKEAHTLLLAVPMQKLGGFAETQTDVLQGRALVACCKGIDVRTGLSPTEILRRHTGLEHPAILTGPSFAHDIAKGLPTALTLACASEDTGRALQKQLSTPCLRLYRSTDVTGAELGGALKNVMAIACGAAVGAGLGDSARAALVTRGFAEMQRMARALGAREQTLAGLSGFGDLVLTCTSEGSRNFRYGLALGQSQAFDPDITVEGAATAQATVARAASLGLDMPITQTVAAICEGKLTVSEAMTRLLSRPLKEELC